MFCLSYDSETQFVLKELSQLFPNWYKFNENKADASLIGYAKAKNLILVNQETINLNATNDKKYKINTVAYFCGAKCTVYGQNDIYCKDENNISFECICFNELVKREKLYENK